MKIISKFTDYYDQMRWVYGEDPLLVLDRRATKEVPYFVDNIPTVEECLKDPRKTVIDSYIEVIFCDKRYRGMKTEKGYVYKRNPIRKYLLQYLNEKDLNSLEGLYLTEDKEFSVWHRWRTWYKERYERFYVADFSEQAINEKYNQVALIAQGDSYSIPNCLQIDFASAVSADKAWKRLTEYLSEQKTKKEKDGDILTNKEKIQSHGFDTKRSFRPKIKK